MTETSKYPSNCFASVRFRREGVGGLNPAALAVLSLLVAMVFVGDAVAQRPFQIYDPFYRDEKASRPYYDKFAITGEIAYNPAQAVPGDGLASISPDPFGYSFRFDYQLADHFDIGIVMDAYGNSTGRSLGVSWVLFKYYRTVDQGDYALRLALDPASDGRGGFPQLDAAFIYSSLLSAEVTTDFAIGARRVSVGYERLVPLDGPEVPIVLSPILPNYGIIYSQALGWEIHGVISYHAHYDPAGSHIFLALLGEAGEYEMVDEPSDKATAEAVEGDAGVTDYRGGVLWLRSGLEFARPRFVFTPFLGLPLRQWAPEDGDWSRHRLQVGLRMMIR